MKSKYFVDNIYSSAYDAFVFCSSSVDEALTNLRILREQLKHLISHLHQELNSQKQTSQQLRKDKVYSGLKRPRSALYLEIQH